MLSLVSSLADRFKEPSSWSVIFTTLAAVGVTVPSGLTQSLALGGAGIAGILGFFLAEKTAPKP